MYSVKYFTIDATPQHKGGFNDWPMCRTPWHYFVKFQFSYPVIRSSSPSKSSTSRPRTISSARSCLPRCVEVHGVAEDDVLVLSFATIGGLASRAEPQHPAVRREQDRERVPRRPRAGSRSESRVGRKSSRTPSNCSISPMPSSPCVYQL